MHYRSYATYHVWQRLYELGSELVSKINYLVKAGGKFGHLYVRHSSIYTVSMTRRITLTIDVSTETCLNLNCSTSRVPPNSSGDWHSFAIPSHYMSSQRVAEQSPQRAEWLRLFLIFFKTNIPGSVLRRKVWKTKHRSLYRHAEHMKRCKCWSLTAICKVVY